METKEILRGLRASAVGLKGLDAAAKPGVYAFFLIQGAGVPGIEQPGGEPLYIGTSDNLARREFDAHFAGGQSGFSTLRRSLGARMIDQLDLQSRPRGTGASETDYRKYGFDQTGEDRLSHWMEGNRGVGVHAVPDPRTIEEELIALPCPPLNLTHWANPDALGIKDARKACATGRKRPSKASWYSGNSTVTSQDSQEGTRQRGRHDGGTERH